MNGESSSRVHVDSLTRWTDAKKMTTQAPKKGTPPRTPFPVASELNQKIILW